MPQSKATKFKAGNFFGSFYQRGGRLVDKHKNVHYVPISYRNVHNPNVVLSSRGKILGGEKNREHEYGYNPRPLPVKYKVLQSQQQKKIMMTLRQKGRI